MPLSACGPSMRQSEPLSGRHQIWLRAWCGVLGARRPGNCYHLSWAALS